MGPHPVGYKALKRDGRSGLGLSPWLCVLGAGGKEAVAPLL